MSCRSSWRAIDRAAALAFVLTVPIATAAKGNEFYITLHTIEVIDPQDRGTNEADELYFMVATEDAATCVVPDLGSLRGSADLDLHLRFDRFLSIAVIERDGDDPDCFHKAITFSHSAELGQGDSVIGFFLEVGAMIALVAGHEASLDNQLAEISVRTFDGPIEVIADDGGADVKSFSGETFVDGVINIDHNRLLNLGNFEYEMVFEAGRVEDWQRRQKGSVVPAILGVKLMAN
jgi:hypothetical protein